MDDVERDLDMKPWDLLKKARPFLISYLRRKPLYCTWQVTDRCNFMCSFCNIWKKEANRSRELTPEEFERAARKLSEIGPLFISLAGGEPFLRKDLVEIIAQVSRYHVPLLTTNGWFVTRELARELFRAGVAGISVSIDYIDPQLHDQRRGMPGAFQKAVEALRVLAQERLYSYQEVNLLCVLLHDNLGQVEDLIKLAESLGATFKIQPYGYLRTGDPFFVPTIGVVKQLLALKRRYPGFLSSCEYLARFDQHFSMKGVQNCMAGRAFFNIDAYGRVSKCVESSDYIGDIRYLEIHQMIKLLRLKHLANDCSSCWYICRGEIERLYTIEGLRTIAAKILSNGLKIAMRRIQRHA